MRNRHPDNLDRALAYINRDQYGAITSFNPASAIKSSTNGHWKRWAVDKNNPTFREQINFVWNYQIKEMYLRYFAWQFIGKEDWADRSWTRNSLSGEEFYNLLEFRPVAIDVVEVGTISRLAQRLHENHRPERWRICGCGPNGGSTDYYVHDFI